VTDPDSSHKLKGQIKKTLFTGDDGYCVARFLCDPDDHKITILGILPGIRPGQRLALTGKWISDPRYGLEFKVTQWKEILPESREGLVKYLSGQFKGVGPKLAERIISTFGRRTLEILEAHPDRLGEVPGIGKQKQTEIIKQWQRNRGLAEANVFLSSLGCPAGG